jgi:LuxR family maltose regulon positive regulatory protein
VLLARLHGAHDQRLILASAAAGSGKSALLAQWASELTEPVAWVSCTDADADSVVFWRHVARAVSDAWAAVGILGAEVLDDDLSVPASLCEQLAVAGSSGVVIIDDVHLARASAAQMVAFISALPRTVRLVLSTRVDPPFSLARMRLHDEVLDIRQADLAFSLDEAGEAVSMLDLDLSVDELARLHELTEGWPAGVHLLALSLRERADRSRVFGGLAAQDRNLADFLLNEVVDRQRPEVRDFLMMSAELERFDPELCDEVTGRTDSAQLLEDVRAANLFLVELDGPTPTYRYHHLFQDFLRLRLQMTGPDAAAAVHRRAGAAYQRRGERSDAMRHYLAGGDLDAAREVLAGEVTNALTVDVDGGSVVARRWLAEYGLRQLEHDSSGILECTMALHVGGAADEAELWLRRWSEREPHLTHAERVLLHGAWSFHHVFVGDPDAALNDGLRAQSLIDLEPVDSRWSDALLVLIVQSQIALSRYDDARATVTAGLRRSSLPPPLALVRLPGLTALADLMSGELSEARVRALRALAAADELGLDELNFGRAEPELVLAHLCIERGELDEAAERLERVMRISEVRRPQVEMRAHLSMAQLADARGDSAAADHCVERARAAVPHATTVVRVQIDVAACRRAVRRGDLAEARSLQARLPPGPEADVLAARIALAAHDHSGARELLEPLHDLVTTTRGRVEVGLLVALATRPTDRLLAAQHLGETLNLTEAAGFHHTVVVEGSALWDILEEVPAHGRLAAHIDALVEAARSAMPAVQVVSQGALIDPLSERELTVLRYLASRLDTSEIAGALYLSANTVRSHVKVIYRKLAVHSRPDAVRRARELGLL